MVQKRRDPPPRGDEVHWTEDVLREDEGRDDFTIGQCYEELAARTLVCIKCGGDKFIVGQGSYFTALKCPECQWESCVHDG